MITKIIISILFFVFAAVQLNDPDPWAWVLLYGAVGALWLTSIWRTIPKRLPQLGLIVVLVWMIWLLPDFIAWIKMGMPTIAGSMKAEAPHIELTREFLGLLICALAFWGLAKK